MSLDPLVVRPLASPEEYAAYYQLANTAFDPEPSEENAQRALQAAFQHPDFRVENIRGAFRADQLLGGYTVFPRSLRMGRARVSTGAIGGVVTAAEARKQGVARALMQDALDVARQERYALLLLDGIPNFYFRFGYIDMFDLTIVEVNRSAILAAPPVVGLSVRLATVDDAPALLELYQRQFGIYTGSFERSLEAQVHRIQYERRVLLVVHSSQGEIEGYMRHGLKDELAESYEIAVRSWDALLALLRYHAELFGADTAPLALQYFLAPESPLVHWIIDRLEVPELAPQSPAEEWGARSITHHHRFTGWMACLVDYSLLADALLPELQARWRRALANWSGVISLVVDGQERVLRIDERTLQWIDAADNVTERIELTAQDFVQLVFGYRPLAQLTDVTRLSEEASSALGVLFPQGHTWIPRTDWF